MEGIRAGGGTVGRTAADPSWNRNKRTNTHPADGPNKALQSQQHNRTHDPRANLSLPHTNLPLRLLLQCSADLHGHTVPPGRHQRCDRRKRPGVLYKLDNVPRLWLQMCLAERVRYAGGQAAKSGTAAAEGWDTAVGQVVSGGA
uniref:Uncharacterized protein n=1 Tax=Mycena chlorophos TaxID=658473 RepID=A0ABQ0LLF6_MYCCL|nr:predicted protein [Mycena chlorophos]